jgi:hypothetical protein
MSSPIEPGDCLGRKLLIVGDVNTGKTTRTGSILEDFCRRGLAPRIAVLDLAPHIPPAIAAARGLKGVGGALKLPGGCDLLAIHERLEAPRLTSASEAEAIAKAASNKALVDAALQRIAASGRSILFVNDISMYLQAGSADELAPHLARPDTVVANGYFGERLGGGELTRHERAQMERLRAWFERAGNVMTLTTSYEVPGRR